MLEKPQGLRTKYKIRGLTERQTHRFLAKWDFLQTRFVNNPRETLTEAGKLIDEVMNARGFPISDFEAQAGERSIGYPVIVEHYRAARAIDLRQSHDQPDAEALCNAMQHYNALLEQLARIELPGFKVSTLRQRWL